MNLTASEQQKLTEQLAVTGAETGIKAFVSRIHAAIKGKKITVVKLLSIFMVLQKAVKDVEAIVAEK